MQSGLVSNIQKYSLQDGPGIRTTVFLKGCPLHCAWCHNPENLSRKAEVVVFETRCARCGHCLEVCPQKDSASLVTKDAPERLNLETPADCLRCGACVEACPTGARVMLGKQMTVQEVLAEILADRIFYDDSRGGVTFSGGEPLLQFEFLQAALQACRDRGIDTAVDTCGFADREHLLAIAQVTDLFLYDLKLMDETAHVEFTGVSNKPILENLQELGRVHRNIWLRIPIIPTVNDSVRELDAMAGFANTIAGIRQIHLLPYHKTGIHKHQRLGREYQLAGLTPPSTERMEAVAARFSAQGLTAKIGG